jgi:DNA-binding NarL/FixJ family response regulator
VVLMDVLMPGMDGAEATAELTRELPSVRVLLLTGTQTDPRIIDAIHAGALGYLSKSAEREELVATIRRVHAGQPSLPPEITSNLLQGLRQPADASSELTPREQEILSLVARGLTNQQIAETIHISEATVRTHMSHILRKLDASNRVEAALWALRHGLAELGA